MLKKIMCKLSLHEYDFVKASGDWLNGGIYTLQCKNCGKVTTAQRWKF